jgi:hypothetical protein
MHLLRYVRNRLYIFMVFMSDMRIGFRARVSVRLCHVVVCMVSLSSIAWSSHIILVIMVMLLMVVIF